MNEIAIDGPAAGRPCINAPDVLPVRTRFRNRSSTCAWRMEGASKCSPAAAVPVRTKIPEPIIAPIPSAVSDHGPRLFFRRCSGLSASAISLSIDLQQRSWLSEVRMVWLDSPKVGCAKRLLSPEILDAVLAKRRPPEQAPYCLPFRGAANQFLHLAFLRTA